MNALAKMLYSGPAADPAAKMCYAIITGDATLAREALSFAETSGRPLMGLRDREAPMAFRLIRPVARDSTVLHDACLYAAAHGHNQIIKMLLKAGADPNLPDMFGYCPLHQAAITNNASACRLLLDAGAAVDAQSNKGYTALHTAIYKRCMDSASILLERGASLKVTNERGLTALDYAKVLNRNELLAKMRAMVARQAAERALRELGGTR